MKTKNKLLNSTMVIKKIFNKRRKNPYIPMYKSILYKNINSFLSQWLLFSLLIFKI